MRGRLHMARRDDPELNRLLARGRLSGAEYDQIEERVLARVAPSSARFRWPLLAVAATCAAAAAPFVLLRAPSEQAHTSSSSRAGTPGPQFTAKGDAPRGHGLVGAGCAGEDPQRCRLGDTLMFSIAAHDSEGYLVAYAERVSGPSPQRIWYFPRAGSQSPRVPAAAETSVWPEGVRLGAPHTRGRYRIVARISEAPLSRSELEGMVNDGEPGIIIDID